jgi:hypothetical protein
MVVVPSQTGHAYEPLLHWLDKPWTAVVEIKRQRKRVHLNGLIMKIDLASELKAFYSRFAESGVKQIENGIDVLVRENSF